MAAYRFCRTDDVPLLVEAYNSCYAVHFPHEPLLTVERFKEAVHDLNLWCSNCMVAMEDNKPIGVLLAAKRDRGTLIYRLGIASDYQRAGHGRHLLNSLSQKLAILGPPTLIAEIPDPWKTGRDFFSACGYTAGTTYTDFVLEGVPAPAGNRDLVTAVSLGDLRESGELNPGQEPSWWRSLKTLENRQERLLGLAVVSDLRIEAWLLYATDPGDGSLEVLALGRAPGEQPGALLGILVRQLAGQDGARVILPRISPEEIDFQEVESWGFQRARDYTRYTATAAKA
ncbi:MAG: GNAT family N-acetyltransferase [Acidobacteria bacterium]|nr:MAG: GNAT family N-acetyltransferase [Acidobacteriota bacterium]